MRKSTITKSAFVAIGVTTVTLLAPQAASALAFSFSFSGVTGIIEGLADNATTNPTSIEVLSSPNGPATYASTGTYNNPSRPGGFDVSSGSITYADWTGYHFTGGASEGVYSLVGLFDDPSLASPLASYWQYCDNIVSGCPILPPGSIIGIAAFAPALDPPPPSASVPGPLPLLGVGAAFCYCRKLRTKIKTSKTPEVLSAFG